MSNQTTPNSTSQRPSHFIFQIVEAFRADPAMVIPCSITFRESFGGARLHELGGASLAMVVIPLFTLARILPAVQDSAFAMLSEIDSPVTHVYFASKQK